MHLSDADLGAALDPAGGGVVGTAARAHASTCDVCRSALHDIHAADSEVGEMLVHLDHPSPSLDSRAFEWELADERIARRSGHGRGRSLSLPRSPRQAPTLTVSPRSGTASPPGTSQHRTFTGAARRSAVILAVSAAVAAAAAAPHSPVRALLARVAPRSRTTASAPRAVPAAVVPAMTAPVAALGPRGVAIAASGHVDLVFRDGDAGGVLRIRLTAGSNVSVTANADGTVYTVGSGTIVVDPHGTSGVTYDVDLPAPARLPAVSIRVGDHRVFARHGGVVRTDGRPEADGSYVVPLGT